MKTIIVNVDDVSEFDGAKQITGYWELMNFFKGYSKEWFKERELYCERHHVYPLIETSKKEIPIIVCLPFRYHFYAHYLRAKMYEGKNERLARANYSASWMILHNVSLKNNKDIIESIVEDFTSVFYEIKKSHIDQFLKDFCKRGSDNNRARSVVCLQTFKKFDTITDAARKTDIGRHLIGAACRNNGVAVSCYHTKKSQYWMYYDPSKPDEWYAQRYQEILSMPLQKKKAWTQEDLDKAAESRRGNSWVQKRSKQVYCITNGITYGSTTMAERALGIDRHKILDCCRGLLDSFDGFEFKYANQVDHGSLPSFRSS